MSVSEKKSKIHSLTLKQAVSRPYVIDFTICLDVFTCICVIYLYLPFVSLFYECSSIHVLHLTKHANQRLEIDLLFCGLIMFVQQF